MMMESCIVTQVGKSRCNVSFQPLVRPYSHSIVAGGLPLMS